MRGGRQGQGGYEYEFDNDILDKGKNTKKISSKENDEIVLHSSNWQQLQYRIKDKNKWSKYQNLKVSPGKKYIPAP